MTLLGAVAALVVLGAPSPASAQARSAGTAADTTSGDTSISCAIGYRVISSWGSGFQGEITIPNPGTNAVNGWDLRFNFLTSSSTVSTMWGGNFTQSGTAVAVTPASYTSVIPAGGSVTVGFLANGSSLNSDPHLFTFSGSTCGATTAGATSGDTTSGTPSVGGTTAGTTTIGGTTAGTTVVGGTSGDHPSTPGTPTVVSVTATSVTLTWTASTDDAGIDHYDVIFNTGDGAASTGTSCPTNTCIVKGFAPHSAWTLAVVAYDTKGFMSMRSGWVNITTAEAPPTTCTIGYHVDDNWNGSFRGQITIPNPGTTDINGWTLGFDFFLSPVITSMSGGNFTQSGTTVAITPTSDTSVIPAGGSVTIDFQASGNVSTYSDPRLFTFNGDTCAAAKS